MGLWTSPTLLAAELCCDYSSYSQQEGMSSIASIDGIFGLVTSIVIFLGIIPSVCAGCLYTSIFVTTGLACIAGFWLWVAAVITHAVQASSRTDNPCSEDFGYLDNMSPWYLWDYEEALSAKCRSNEQCMALTKVVEIPPEMQKQFGLDSENCNEYSAHSTRVVFAILLLCVALGCAMMMVLLNCVSVCCSPHDNARVHQGGQIQQAQVVPGTVIMMTSVAEAPMQVQQPMQVQLPRAPGIGSLGGNSDGAQDYLKQ